MKYMLFFVFTALLWTSCEKEPDPFANDMFIIAGNNQNGYINLALTEPVTLLVHDQNGLPFPGKTVNIAVDEIGFGTVSSGTSSGADIQVQSDSTGSIFFVWTLGSSIGTQSITVSAAEVSTTLQIQCRAYPWLQDSRDNKIYKTIEVGTQNWMAENLSYQSPGAVDYFKDSNTVIPAVYGKLYQWSEAINVCPSGWHLPSDNEWTTLQQYIGGSNVGYELKSSNNWLQGNGSNSYGMNVYPAGLMKPDSSFIGLGTQTWFWSATEFDADNARLRKIFSSSDGVTQGYNNKAHGLSIRCVKD